MLLPELTNLRYLRMDAEDLPEVFGEGEVSGIYLNFSDPWQRTGMPSAVCKPPVSGTVCTDPDSGRTR